MRYIHKLKSCNYLIIMGIVLSAFILSSLMLSSPHTYAETATASVTVSAACSFTAGGKTNTASLTPGTSTELTSNAITTSCNDHAGYAIYAIGYSGDSYSASTHTDLINSTNSSYNIKTDGTGSNWKMKLTNLSNATVANSFDSYQNIPSSFTKVASYGSATTSGSITPKYQVTASSAQVAGSYTGKVKYVLIHPSTNSAGTYTIAYNANGGTGTMSSSTGLYNFEEQTLPANTFTAPSGYQFAGWCTTNTSQYECADGISYADGATNPANIANANGTVTLYAYWQEMPLLYNAVAAMSKGTQTLAQLRAAITVPTSADRTQDTSNSGVYEYNTSVFGAATDAASTHKIYYYRGVLENSVGSYGSDGSAVTYPNYVILDADGSKTTADTCWRIVRTTGSGGVKMIYNGKWTGSTCANSTTNAQVTTKAFDTTANSSGKSIVGVGYTYNASYKSTTSSTAYSTLFGSNTSYSGNSTASTMKTYIENTWFTNINSYSSILEPSAGYCNDRTIRSSSSSTSVIGDSTSISTPYATATSGITQYYFGARVRNMTTSDKPTLGCPRSNADLYTTSNASNGNKRLSKPAALITADEAAFAGSGYSSTTPYHANSFLRSGSSFWLLSPGYRSSSGVAIGFNLNSNGLLYYYSVGNSYGVRPAISLTSGTTIASGSGTATDPWVVTAP